MKCENDSKNKILAPLNLIQNMLSLRNTKKCLDGGEYQKERKIYFLRSINYEKYLQQVNKSTSCIFDDKRCYESNIESKPPE